MFTKRQPFKLVPVLVLFFTSAVFGADTFKFDPVHTSVSFRIRHLVTRVEGRFTQFEGTILMDQKNPSASSVEFTIKAASIDTKVEKRDSDLRSASFFDVEKYPLITFTSSKVVKKSEDLVEVTGNLTMHGVVKTVTLPVKFLGIIKDPWGGTRAGFELQTTLNRKDFGITTNQALAQGGFLLGDEVEVTILVEALKPPEEKK